VETKYPAVGAAAIRVGEPAPLAGVSST